MENNKLNKWFNNGLIKEAILGKDSFFISDYHWIGQHDYSSVLYHLKNWAYPSKSKEATKGIHDAIDQMVKDDNTSMLIFLIWVILLELEKKDDNKFAQIFNFDPEFLTEKIFPYLNTKSQLFINNEEERRSLLLVCSKLPQLADKLGFGEIEVIMDEKGLYVTDIKAKPKVKIN